MAMSQFATCATTTQPQLYCWGGDMQNQFGASPPPTGCDISGFNFGCTPVPTAGPAGFPVVTGSPRNFCGVATGGIAYCWGGNDLKQIGNPAVTLSATPVVFTIDPSSSL